MKRSIIGLIAIIVYYTVMITLLWNDIGTYPSKEYCNKALDINTAINVTLIITVMFLVPLIVGYQLAKDKYKE